MSRNSGSQFWPILGIIANSAELNEEVFVLGLYHGLKKPDDKNKYLSSLVLDLNNLMSSGFYYNGNHILVRHASFVCDAPAFALIAGVKNHGGRRCCRKCCVIGEWALGQYDGSRRMAYIETNAEPRTNTSFRERWDPEYHNGDTILEQLNIDMVVDFPYDPMHQLYLGVTKSWASYVVTDREFKISDDAGKLMNKFIVMLTSSTSREFGRKVRTFEYIAKFKATEWRTFLLYTGPVIMKNRLSSERFNHFMTLHVAMKLLSSESWCYEYNDFAKQLLKNFVENARIIYGRHFLTYNVHS